MPDWGFAQVDQQWYNTPTLLANAERMYDEVKTLQPKYWRIGAAWSLIAKQREPGTFVAGTPPTSTGRDWTTLDTSLNEALLLGSEVILILGVRKASWGGFWFGPFSFGASWGSEADFKAWCAEVVTRYKVGGVGVRTDGRYASNAFKGVHIFEIWNEENDQNHWGSFVSARDYTNFLIPAYDGIKSVLPGTSSTVLFGGTYHVQRIPPWPLYGIASLPEVDFVSQCYNYGAKDKFDAMAVHVYPHLDDVSFNGSDVGPVPTMNLDNMRQLTEIRDVMVAKGDSAKKIWITEAGFPCSHVTEAQQSTYWQSLWGLFSALPYIEAVLFYCARDQGINASSVEQTWGAMRYDFTKKPVWSWLATLSPPPARPAAFTSTSSLTATIQRTIAANFTSGSDMSATTDVPGFRNAMFASSSSFTASVKPSLSVAANFTAASTMSAGIGQAANFASTSALSASIHIPVLWNSTGTGGRATTGSVSWTHNTTVTGSDVYVFAEVGFSHTAGGTLSMGAMYGSVPMTALGYQFGAGAGVVLFGLQSPPTGTQTVTTTLSGVPLTSLQGTSVAFTNVGTIPNPPVGTSGTSTARSLTLAAVPGSRALAVTTGESTNGSSAPATVRYAGGGSVSGNGDYVTVLDCPGEADGFVSLSTVQSARTTWSVLGLVLNPV